MWERIKTWIARLFYDHEVYDGRHSARSIHCRVIKDNKRRYR